MRWNPLQAQLIRSHVTLIREDEVDDWSQLAKRLQGVPVSLCLEFGSPKRQQHFVYYPCIAGQAAFHQLRCELLQVKSEAVRVQEPHITLIHPRNGVCTDATFAEVLQMAAPFSCHFHEVTLIEQAQGGRWLPV
jgi:hypothetical protein